MAIDPKEIRYTGTRNRLSGITPVAATWDVNPATLGNSTDGNYATVTGNGNKVLGAAGTVGLLTWDLGAIYKVLVKGLVGLGNNIVGGADGEIYLLGSDDNVIYVLIGSLYGKAVTEWMANQVLNRWIGACFLRCRYVRLQWRGPAAGTWYGNVTELEAVDLGV